METTQGLDNRAREEFRQQLRAEVAEALRRQSDQNEGAVSALKADFLQLRRHVQTHQEEVRTFQDRAFKSLQELVAQSGKVLAGQIEAVRTEK